MTKSTVGEPSDYVRAEESRRAEGESDLPAGLAKPARRALAAAGYLRLDQLTDVSDAELLRLHGMGPKALDQIRRALAASGRSLASTPRE